MQRRNHKGTLSADQSTPDRWTAANMPSRRPWSVVQGLRWHQLYHIFRATWNHHEFIIARPNRTPVNHANCGNSDPCWSESSWVGSRGRKARQTHHNRIQGRLEDQCRVDQERRPWDWGYCSKDFELSQDWHWGDDLLWGWMVGFKYATVPINFDRPVGKTGCPEVQRKHTFYAWMY